MTAKAWITRFTARGLPVRWQVESADRGIILCGTGVGIGITANKVPGIRCVTCSDTYSARMSRLHNNANMIALGSRVLGTELAKDILRIWLTTDFSDEQRHRDRVQTIARVERGEEIE